MIAPTNNMTIRFTDDKISRILRTGVDRDVLRNMRNHIIIMKDVPFGIANRILNVTNIDVNLLKDPEENWFEVMCGDEETLKNIYYGNVAPKNEPSVVITEDPKIEESVMVEDPVEEEKIEEASESIQDEVVKEEPETVEENVQPEPEAVETEEVSEDSVSEDDESSDETMEDEELTENVVESTEETDTTSEEVVEEEAKPAEPVQVVRPVENVRRQVNVNNNRHRKHH